MKTKTECPAKTETTGPSGRARIGKIAKLPRLIREELNVRLSEGEATASILQWLNGHPSVRMHLEEYHQGSPITEDNLSRWRQGGFAGWAENVKLQESLDAMTQACSELDDSDRRDLIRRIGTVLMSRLVSQMQAFDSMPEGTEKAKFWSEMVWSYIALRKTDLNYQQFDLERRKATTSELMMQLEDRSKSDHGMV